MSNTALQNYMVDPTFASTVAPINQQAQAQSFAPITQPSLPSGGDLNNYYQQAFAALQPYYQAKLQQAQGDLTEAMNQITYDYQTGMRYNTQDTQMAQQRQTEDFNSALQSLGLQSQQETQKQEDTLNQRGIALVQGPNGQAQAASGGQMQYDQNGVPVSGSNMSYDANGNPTYSGGQGEAGNELSMLEEDQRLRQEAETRASQRNLQDIGIKGQRQAASLAETQGTSTYAAQRQFQNTGESLGEQEQQQAYSIAGEEASQATQQQELSQQTSLYNAQLAAAQQGSGSYLGQSGSSS